MNSTYKPGKDAEGSYDGIEDFGPWDRCITRGLPVSMEPRNYNNGIRITQSPGFVIITVEMAHEARVIPTTPTAQARSCNQGMAWGVARTLGRQHARYRDHEFQRSDGTDQRRRSRFSRSTAAVIDEHDNHRAHYPHRPGHRWSTRSRLIDPTVLATGSFTVAYPMMLDNSYQMFEYACHEGNTAIRNYIETARYAKAHPKPATAAPAGGARRWSWWSWWRNTSRPRSSIVPS